MRTISRALFPSIALCAVTLHALPAEGARFKANYQGTFAISDRLVFSGDGHATLLGPSTVNGETTSAPIGQDGCPAGYVFFQIVTDFVVLESKNHPENAIFITNRGGDCINFVTGDILGTGTYTITGGTGRFAGATGTGVWTVRGDLNTSRFRLAFRGTIRVDHDDGDDDGDDD